MPAVLILGGRAPVALDHARRFARQGWKACVADSIPFKGTAWSRYVHQGVRIPSPRSEPREFAKALARTASEHRIDLLLPTCEEVFYVSRYRTTFPRELTVATDDFEKLTMLHSKLEFTRLAAGCGAKVPETCSVSSLHEARDWARGRAVVLKPEFSRFGVYVRIYPSGIPADAPELAEHGRWVVQEFCEGEELCSYSVAVNGRLTAHMAYRPLYRLSRSSSYYFDPVQAPAIRAFVERFVRKMSYTGQISFDWIQGADGQYAVLECNPRAISGVHVFAATDALPAALRGTAGNIVEPRVLGERVEAGGRPARMIATLMLTAGLTTSARAGRLPQWRRDFMRASDVIAERGDSGPLLGAIADLGLHALRAGRNRCSLREAATRDIEWDGERLPEC
jgi:predicted ATP-grasp superfamily ATP-dependent carboligase